MDARIKAEESKLPNDRDSALAARACRQLAALASGAEPVPARFGEANEACVELPASAVRLLGEILGQMAQGNGVALVPLHAELSVPEVAAMLHVPESHLEKLLDGERILCRQSGAQRHVRTESLLAYYRGMELRRREALDEMTAYDQELGLQ